MVEIFAFNSMIVVIDLMQSRVHIPAPINKKNGVARDEQRL